MQTLQQTPSNFRVLKTKKIATGVIPAINLHHLDAVSAVFTALSENGSFSYMMEWAGLCALKKQCAKLTTHFTDHHLPRKRRPATAAVQSTITSPVI